MRLFRWQRGEHDSGLVAITLAAAGIKRDGLTRDGKDRIFVPSTATYTTVISRGRNLLAWLVIEHTGCAARG